MEEASKNLQRFVDGDKRAKTHDYGMFLLMQAYDASGNREKAIDTAKEALDILWAMTGADHYRLFVVDRKWSAARYEAWLENTLERLLLR